MTQRNWIMESLEKKRSQTRAGTYAVHGLGYYANRYGLKDSDFPVAAASEDTRITLPVFRGMKD